MKIIDCEKQLNSILNRYNKFYNINERISNTLLFWDEEKSISYALAREMYYNIYDIYKIIPHKDVDINKHFESINLDILTEFKNQYKLILEEMKKVPEIEGREKIYNIICHIINFEDSIKLKTYFEAIDSLFDLFNKWQLYKTDRCDKLYEDIFNACLNYKNDALEYINNLELPTIPD